MGFKCTPQILGLTRGDPKPGQKHRANGKAIAGEVGEHEENSHERLTKSHTYNPDLSHLNKYYFNNNGYDVWDDMMERANKYRVPVKTKNGEYERALPPDAVIGYAMIFNPPEEVCKDWDDDEYRRFYDDSFGVMGRICPEIFRAENIRMIAEHADEGMPPYSEKDRHEHFIGDCIDKNGRYCGNKIDAKLFVKINEMYPKMMRDRGWDMDDLDTTDWNRYKSDPDYKMERKVKKKTSGLSVNEYHEKKTSERTLAAYDEAEMILQDVQALKRELEDEKEKVSEKNERLNKEIQNALNAKSGYEGARKAMVDITTDLFEKAEALRVQREADEAAAEAKVEAEQKIANNPNVRNVMRKADESAVRSSHSTLAAQPPGRT